MRPGDQIRVVKGAFAGFSGVVDQVDHARKIITVSANIFGRTTLVQLTPTAIEPQ